MEIDHEIFSMVILSLPLIQERLLSVLFNRLEDYACQVWLGNHTYHVRLNMILIVLIGPLNSNPTTIHLKFTCCVLTDHSINIRTLNVQTFTEEVQFACYRHGANVLFRLKATLLL